MRRFILLAIICLSFSLAANAKPINRNQAKANALSFLEARGLELQSEKPMLKARVNATTDDEAYYYVFNAADNKGFVIVSGDDRTEQILGYTSSGSFDQEKIPDNIHSWLQHYADEMEYLTKNSVAMPGGDIIQAKAAKKSSPARHFVPTLMTSTWNQGSPYNDKCPMYYNGDGSSGTSATGCVATALAQVLYYYKHPAKTKTRIPTMSNTYNLDDGTTKTVTLPGIKSGTEIDWANMLDNYTGNETQAQKDAVAGLMLMCGQAVKMGYGSSSGAVFGDNIPEMYKKYFDYDDKAYAASRDQYTSAEWFNLIYNEVAAGHPIPMAGYSSGGGHSFVIDGFDGDELFHINWGWGGYCDGYFRISVMNPDDNSGIGASNSSDGYAMGECIVIGLDLPDDEDTESRTHMSINDTKVEGKSVFSNYINWTGGHYTFDCSIVGTDENGVLVPASETQQTTLDANYYVGFTFNLDGAITTPGTYKLSPASKVSTNSIWRPEFNMQSEYIEVVVDDDGKTSSVKYHTPVEAMEVTDWNFTGSLVSDKEQEVKVTFKNNGDEYYREMTLFASQTNSKSGTDCRCAVTAKEGETVTFSFYFTPDDTGDWNLWLCTGSDGSGEVGKTTVTIGSTAKNQANLHVNSFSMSNNSYGNCLVGSISVKNNGAQTYDGYIKLNLWKYNPDDGMCWGCGTQRVSINVASGATTFGNFDFENLEIGGQYFISASYTNQDGDLDNGGLTWDHEWTLKTGYLTWGSTGSIAGSAAGTMATIGNAISGALFQSVDIATIKPGTNPNTIYAFVSASVPSTLNGYNTVKDGIAEDISIVSGKAMYSPVTFTAKKATFSHTFATAGDGCKGWEAITLPFKPTRITIDGNEVSWKHDSSDGDFWLREFSELTGNNEVLFTNVENLASLRGNTPYVIAAPEEYVGKTIVFEGEEASFNNTGKDNMLVSSDAFNFFGTTINKRMGDIYVLNDAGDAYEFTESNKSIKAFNNYFTWKLDEVSRPASIKISNDATGIKDVNPELKAQSSKLYDLQGREVTNPTRGMYIVNGKTVIINK